MNCRSVRNKSDLISDHILEYNLDFTALTETWLSPNNQDSSTTASLVPKGYQLHHTARSGCKGGGVGIISKENFHVKQVPSFTATSFESMEIMATAVSVIIRLVVLYRFPPSSKNKLKRAQFIAEFSDLLEYLAPLTGKLVIVGDFNVHWDDKSNAETKQSVDTLHSFGFTQHVTGPIHLRGHTLDLVLTRSADSLIHPCLIGDLLSDHHSIHVQLKCAKPHPQRKMVSFRKVEAIDNAKFSDQINNALSMIPVHDVSLDDCVASYNHVLSSLLDEHAPMKQKSFVERDLKPWITDEILDEKRARRKSEKQWRKTKLTVHQISYKEHCVKVQLIIKKAKTDYFRDKIEKCEGDQGELFKI